MSEREMPVGIFRRVTGTIAAGIVNAWRGYSPKDINAAQRIASGGEITPEQRRRFLDDEASRLSAGLGLFDHNSQLNLDPPILPLGMGSIMDEIISMQKLTPEQLDTQIRNKAEQNLRLWGKL